MFACECVFVCLCVSSLVRVFVWSPVYVWLFLLVYLGVDVCVCLLDVRECVFVRSLVLLVGLCLCSSVVCDSL